MRLMPGISSPLANRSAADIDMICVRENSEGEYCGMGGRLHGGTPYELAEQTGIFTRQGIERIARYAFKLAQTRPRKMLASATKSNALQHAMVLWDEVVADVAKEFPDVELTKYHVDALCARMITHPQTLDVIVASNLFGDILTDIGSAISGSLGVGPGGNINPERTTPSMFEPIHGSAPDIAGKGDRQPDRRHLGRRDDGRPPRRDEDRGAHPRGDRRRAVRRAREDARPRRQGHDRRHDPRDHHRARRRPARVVGLVRVRR